MSKRSPITTHVLETSLGQPAKGLHVTLDRQESSGAWNTLAQGKTNDQGRIEDLLEPGSAPEAGTYRLQFKTGEYYGSKPCFYPLIEITFEVGNEAHYHVPLLLNPFGYSTYRGT